VNKSARILLNTSYQLAGRAIVLLLSLVTLSLTAKYLGPTSYGLLTTALVFISFFTAFVDFGATSVILRDAANDREKLLSLVRSYLGMSLTYALPLVLVMIVAGLLIYPHAPNDLRLGLIILPLSAVFGTIISSYNPLLQADIRLGVPALAEVVTKFVNLGLIILLINQRASLIWFYVMIALLPAIGAIYVAYAVYRHYGLIRPTFDTKIWRYLVRSSLPIGMSLIVFALYLKADAFILSKLVSPEQVGIYGIAYRVIEAVSSVPGFFITAAFATLAASYADKANPEKFNQLVRRSISLMLLVAIPMFIGGLIVAPKLIRAIAGDEFSGAVTPLIILLGATSISFVNAVWGNVLIIAQRQKFLFVYSLINLVFNIVLNLALIPASIWP
jgi:O-antigen/teichoic acid export membrane protein